MTFERFDIYFSGQIIEGKDRTAVKTRIAKSCRASQAQLERLFSGTPVAIKKDVDMETAIRYRVLFRDAGALIDIRKVQPPRQATPSPAPPQTLPAEDRAQTPEPGLADEFTLAPARTGSLEDLAPKPVPLAIPDVSGIGLAPAGELLPAQPESPPPDIDTSRLTLYPVNSGSLLDCRQKTPPAPLPDISALRLVGFEEE